MRGRQVGRTLSLTSALGTGAHLLSAVGCGSSSTEPDAAHPTVDIPATSTGPPPPSGELQLPPKKEAPAPPIAWMHDVPGAMERAAAQQSLIVVAACATWSAPCIRVEREVWTDPEVRRSVASYVPVLLDFTDASHEDDLWAAKLDLRVVPVVVLLDADGIERDRLEGFQTREEVLGFLGRAR